MTPDPEPRRRIAARALLLFVAAGLAVFAVAPPARADSGAAAISPDQRAYWRDKAAELRSRMAAAGVREAAATAAYSRMLTRRYPAGEAKLAIIDERDAALKELGETQVELREFKRQAREAGVPDQWIDPEGTPPSWWIDPYS
jgi:hypothetical protein